MGAQESAGGPSVSDRTPSGSAVQGKQIEGEGRRLPPASPRLASHTSPWRTHATCGKPASQQRCRTTHPVHLR
eukprot:4082392-Pyramimonas_sp.AAC.1